MTYQKKILHAAKNSEFDGKYVRCLNNLHWICEKTTIISLTLRPWNVF